MSVPAPPPPAVIELHLPPHSTAAASAQLHMHPLDYELLQQAAESQEQSLADFIVLAAYLHAREVLAEIQARHTVAAAAAASTTSHHPTADASTTTRPRA